LSLGNTGGFLVSKLVKPTKVFCSWASHEMSLGDLIFPEAKPDIGATAAGILGKTDSTVRQEVSGLDSSNRVFCQLTDLTALFIGNCCAQVLGLNQSLANKNNLSDLRNAGHPGITAPVSGNHPAYHLVAQLGYVMTVPDPSKPTVELEARISKRPGRP
jgi:hypothetical protein